MKSATMTSQVFRSLCVKDLLAARDAYHVYLSNMPNVVGSAIGLYRFRPGEDEYHNFRPKHRRPTGRKPPRTLTNSIITPESQPCVIVFVRKWLDWKDRRALGHPDEVVPRHLYLPDGAVAPTCVILVAEDEYMAQATEPLIFPRSFMGGGYPILTEVQGETRVGTVGCLVTDGDEIYALTASHVAGAEGRGVSSILAGERRPVGVSSAISRRKVKATEIYPEWPGTHCVQNTDVGLVRVGERDEWTAQVYGLGALEPVMNITPENLSLDLIGEKVIGFGAASHLLRGEIHALFYRYHSMGGFDYQTDILIGPREGDDTFKILPGDSGMLVCLDLPQASGGQAPPAVRNGSSAEELAPKTYKPLAILWGGHDFVSGSRTKRYSFALGTFMSTICRTLDLELVRGWQIGLRERWGKPVHFGIGYYAHELLPAGKLKDLIGGNLPSIGIPLGEGIPERKDGDFFPLADAPDAWAFAGPRPQDKANHCANLDMENDAGISLREWSRTKRNFTPQGWADFYDSISSNGIDRGALPFRIEQVYEAMVQAIRARNQAETVFAAGILAHYAGDVTMPLHGIEDYKGKAYGTPASTSRTVHKFYDREILERCAAEFTQEMEQRVHRSGSNGFGRMTITDGRSAARTTLQLMNWAFDHCPKEQLFDAYTEWWDHRDYGTTWGEIGEPISDAAFMGAKFLSKLWQAAWKEGGGDARFPKPRKVPAARLRSLFYDKTCLESVDLTELQGRLGY